MTQPAQQLPAVQAKNELEYAPFGSEEKIKLSTNIIRNYIATPTREGDLPEERECMRFLMLCRSRRLNPFEGDAFLIGFKKRDEPKPTWNLITAHVAFLKRAEVHPEFDGLRSGVIVKTEEGQIVDRVGDFTFDGDKILGGWAVVHFQNRKHPMEKRAKLSTYQKPFGVWQQDPAGMIVKVAEADALRSAFPTMLGGMYLREEVDIYQPTPSATAKTPDFGNDRPATVEVSAPVRETRPRQTKAEAKPEQKSEPPTGGAEPGKPEPASNDDGDLGPQAKQPGQPPAADAATPAAAPAEPFTPRAGESEVLTAVRQLLHENALQEPQLLNYGIEQKFVRAGQKLAELSEAKLKNIASSFGTMMPDIRKQPAF